MCDLFADFKLSKGFKLCWKFLECFHWVSFCG